MLTIMDFDGAVAKEKEFSNIVVLPEGDYVGTITRAKDINEAPGKGYLATSFRVEEGDLEGKEMPVRWYYGDAERIGYAKIIGLMKACGYAPQRAFDEQMLVGPKFLFTIKGRKDKRDGSMRYDVHSVSPFTDAGDASWTPPA